MVTLYVYALLFNGKPFYVGISNNPARRLMQHYTSSYFATKPIFKMAGSYANIEIRILDMVHQKSNRVEGKAVQVEAYWIHKYLMAGHALVNINIKLCSRIPINYYKQIQENGKDNRKKVRLKDIQRENIPGFGKRG